MKNKIFAITIIYSILSCFLLYTVENFFDINYIFTVLQKIILFVIIPFFIIYYFNAKEKIIWKINKDSFKYWILFWILAFVIIGISYFVLNDFIDWSNISNQLSNKWINQNTFIIIFIYIMFWNAFIEELFFRGFIFNIISKTNTILAYVLSSALFSLYHIAIFWTWFDPLILLLGLIWLFLGWLFFAFLYQKTRWIWAAYIFHIIADAVILIIWYVNLF